MFKILDCLVRSRIELAGKQMELGASINYYGAKFMIICRYLMYIGKEGEVYMLDRDNAVFSIPNLQFPSKHAGQAHLKDTLMDGVINVLSRKFNLSGFSLGNGFRFNS